jgi:Carboxypeptidase regulatory-like domain
MRMAWISLIGLVMLCPVLTDAQSIPDLPSPATSAAHPSQQPETGLPGNITGTVVDPKGAPLAGAKVGLAREGKNLAPEILSGDDGQFTFPNVMPGPFQVTISGEGFAPQTASGVLHSKENYVVPPVALAVATAVTEVRVELSAFEIAQEQLKEQEKQRVLGVIPNFYVSYVPNAAPLTPQQKFNLAWKSTIDPVSFAVTAVIAGVQQSQNDFSGYGQGAQGYAKRYGADYADFAISTFIGGAILPSVLHQDPRYFYKGSGSKKSRALYAIANAVICKGDNGHWQANYSGILGSLAAGGISNLYYPASDRGGTLIIENTLIGIGASAGVNLLQEFVMKKLTPNLPRNEPVPVTN